MTLTNVWSKSDGDIVNAKANAQAHENEYCERLTLEPDATSSLILMRTILRQNNTTEPWFTCFREDLIQRGKYTRHIIMNGPVLM